MLVELENYWLVVCQVVNPRNGLLTYKKYIEKSDTLIGACLLHDNETIVRAEFHIKGEETI